jgi:hypothetical protein
MVECFTTDSEAKQMSGDKYKDLILCQTFLDLTSMLRPGLRIYVRSCTCVHSGTLYPKALRGHFRARK